MSSSSQATIMHVPTYTNDPPPSYHEAFNIRSTDPPSYSELFNLTPVFHSIFGTATSLNFEFHSGGYSGYSDYFFLIRDNDGKFLAKVNVGSIQTRVNDINDVEIFKFNKADSDDLDEQNIHAFEMRDKNSVINIIKIKENGRCVEIIHKYSDPKLTVISLKIGEYAVFRSNSSSKPLCNVRIAKRFKPNEFSGSITFHPDTGISTLEHLLCTASVIALKIVIKKEEGKWPEKCLITFACVILFIVVILMIFHLK